MKTSLTSKYQTNMDLAKKYKRPWRFPLQKSESTDTHTQFSMVFEHLNVKLYLKKTLTQPLNHCSLLVYTINQSGHDSQNEVLAMIWGQDRWRLLCWHWQWPLFWRDLSEAKQKKGIFGEKNFCRKSISRNKMKTFPTSKYQTNMDFSQNTIQRKLKFSNSKV